MSEQYKENYQSYMSKISTNSKFVFVFIFLQISIMMNLLFDDHISEMQMSIKAIERFIEEAPSKANLVNEIKDFSTNVDFMQEFDSNCLVEAYKNKTLSFIQERAKSCENYISTLYTKVNPNADRRIYDLLDQIDQLAEGIPYSVEVIESFAAIKMIPLSKTFSEFLPYGRPLIEQQRRKISNNSINVGQSSVALPLAIYLIPLLLFCLYVHINIKLGQIILEFQSGHYIHRQYSLFYRFNIKGRKVSPSLIIFYLLIFLSNFLTFLMLSPSHTFFMGIDNLTAICLIVMNITASVILYFLLYRASQKHLEARLNV